MGWVRIDDSLYDHPKFMRLPAGAVRLWLFGMAWSNRHATDGRLPGEARTLLRGKNSDVKSLEQAGLWIRQENGWLIHDYLEYQLSRAQMEAAKRRNRERQTRYRNAVTNAVSNTAPTQPNPNINPPVVPPGGGTETKPASRAKPKRWRRAPKDWQPKPSHAELAAQLGVDLTAEEANFRDHEYDKPKSDADAAFRNWLRNSKRFAPKGAPPGLTRHQELKADAEAQRLEANTRHDHRQWLWTHALSGGFGRKAQDAALAAQGDPDAEARVKDRLETADEKRRTKTRPRSPATPPRLELVQSPGQAKAGGDR